MAEAIQEFIERQYGKRGEPCRKCQQRPATELWAHDALALTHGGAQWWCQRCAVAEQLRYAREAAARIPDLEAQLSRLDL